MPYFARQTQGASGAPLFFTCHGTGATEDQFHTLAEQLLPGAHVTSPRGNVTENGALRYFRRTAEGVYDMDDLAQRRAMMADFIAKERAIKRPSQTIAMGYSNGANILAAVALVRPDLLDTLILMHPLIPWDPAPQPELSGRRVLITAGKRDPICPADRTQALADYLTAQGADVQIHWHPGGHEVANSEVDAIALFLRG
ncbi:alpha/beta hydrolase [Yoonia sp.]|uniref:alpha/beta hydrolase n=1 Tax=Yoonia sp. TaxID=2212373 RepID=UPI001A0373C9|nr:alpha/beta hydrolase [Yoonia sp.]MBE0413902.1 alpha/beta hydrolase [Yoonia sp.]